MCDVKRSAVTLYHVRTHSAHPDVGSSGYCFLNLIIITSLSKSCPLLPKFCMQAKHKLEEPSNQVEEMEEVMRVQHGEHPHPALCSQLEQLT